MTTSKTNTTLERSLTPLNKANRKIKVSLSVEEISRLDQIVLEMGLDRSSTIRHMLKPFIANDEHSLNDPEAKNSKNEVSRIRVSDIGAKIKPSIKLFEPRSFDEIPNVVSTIKDGVAVVLNLTLMEPDQAQRAVDFVAGAAFYGDGHQERVGESIFLFAPDIFEVNGSGESVEGGGEQKLISADEPKENIDGSSPADALKKLTGLQAEILGLVNQRWEQQQLETTAYDVVEARCPDDKREASTRLARRVLSYLARHGLIDSSGSDIAIRARPLTASDVSSESLHGEGSAESISETDSNSMESPARYSAEGSAVNLRGTDQDSFSNAGTEDQLTVASA